MNFKNAIYVINKTKSFNQNFIIFIFTLFFHMKLFLKFFYKYRINYEKKNKCISLIIILYI